MTAPGQRQPHKATGDACPGMVSLGEYNIIKEIENFPLVLCMTGVNSHGVGVGWGLDLPYIAVSQI